MSILIRILRYMRPYWRRAALIYSATVAVTLLTLISPWLIGNAIDTTLGNQDRFPLYPAGCTKNSYVPAWTSESANRPYWLVLPWSVPLR